MTSVRCVHEVFEEQADRYPASAAITSGGERLTYAELDARADMLASRLTEEGVRRGAIAAIHLDRGPDMVVAILATLKAGAGYLMLDPEFPAGRLLDIARAAAVDVVIGREPRGLAVPARFVGVAERGRQPLTRGASGARPDDVACVMFTSGSTGRPKGVAAPHRAITSSLCGQPGLRFGPGTVWLQCAPVSWDAFALELWGGLLSGGSCVLHPGQRPDPVVMAELAAKHQINTMYLSCSLFNVIVDECPGVLTGVRDVMVGGEPPSARHLDRAIRQFPALRVLHAYGPVECMIFLTTHPVTADYAAAGRLPIGRPLSGKRVYVLDASLRPVADGEIGELYGAGEGLANGYLAQPGLTAERFIACPFGEPGARMYRTGDLARRHGAGPLEFVGRADEQVKIRGFRVEPAEVEALLGRHPAVERIAVIAARDRNGDKQLAAYLVPRAGQDGEALGAALRAYASELLPDFMVPSAFVALSTLPLTPNGKLDRSALPTPTAAVRPRSPASRGPRNGDEETLCELFAGVLGVAPGGVDDSFFDLGGNSLQAVRLVNRIRTALGARVTIRAVFEAPTVAALAGRLGDRDAQDQPLPELAQSGTALPDTALPGTGLPDAGPLSFAQLRLWLVDQIDGGTAYTLPVLAELRGEVDAAALQAALTDVVARHEPLRTVFVLRDGEPAQRVLPAADARLRLSAVRVAAAELDTRIAAARQHRFDLSAELPVRAILLTGDEDDRRHVLLLVLHHIAVDGWSLGPLLRDLSLAYAARRDGAAPRWRPLPVRYRDFAIRQRARLGDRGDPGSVMACQLRYWASATAGLGDALARLREPGRAAVAGAAARSLSWRLDAAGHARLTGLAKEHGGTLFMVLQAGLAAVLHRGGAGADVAIGTVVAGRDSDDLDDLVGLFANMLVLRTDLSGDPTAAELLGRIKETSLAAFSHQDVPFDQVVHEINPPRRLGRHPLTDVVMVLQNNVRPYLSLPGAQARVTVLRPGTARFGLLVEATDDYGPDGSPAGLELTVEYRPDVLGYRAARWLATCLDAVLAAMAADPAIRVTSAALSGVRPAPALATPPDQEPGPVPRPGSQEGPGSQEAPGTSLAGRLAAIWADVLGVERVGAHDNFFAIGGNSLSAVRAAARMVTTEHVSVTAAQIFAAPTIAELAGVLASAPTGAGPVIPRAPRVPRAATAGSDHSDQE